MYLTSLSHPRPVSLLAVVKVEVKVFLVHRSRSQSSGGWLQGVLEVVVSKWVNKARNTQGNHQNVPTSLHIQRIGLSWMSIQVVFLPMHAICRRYRLLRYVVHPRGVSGEGEKKSPEMYCIGTHQYFIHFLAYAVWGGSFIGQTHAPTLGGKICSSFAANER